MTKDPVVGVLALQGAFAEHLNHFEKAIKAHPDQYSQYNFQLIEVKTEQQLNSCDALVIPGGESTSISLIAERTGLLPHLYSFIADDSKAVWGTCAGLIFLAKQVENAKPNQKTLGGMDIKVIRNAFGRQLDSFEQKLDFSEFIPSVTDFSTIFIRAPIVDTILADETKGQLQQNLQHPPVPKVPMAKVDDSILVKSDNIYTNPSPVEILHKLDNGFIVAVRQGSKLGTSFHPELSDDFRFHKWFLDEFCLKNDK